MFLNRLYFRKDTGVFLTRTYMDDGDSGGFNLIPPSIEDDFNSNAILSQYMRDAVIVKEFVRGEYEQDFAECNGYRVNPETLQIEFSYPDPNETEPSEPLYIVPLSEQIAANTDYLLDVDSRLMMVELGMI